ncbi:30S ribosomal protein S2 [endosymbiont of Pachyrhynchus infernalis]|uniref:30S ribosomal protein S2 n=1 Tax=endosymbiont of Pachyrhynchus infernalis TaxID=1971488 RepID=UPI000DC73FEA|nr:30S ribosomal protein S2 [endosymbiont of Pachyrhynchus infernalis]BBA84801.1 30S ribosomal protein S2 [endosymbiont of Pachyrhynchus infernalis]
MIDFCIEEMINLGIHFGHNIKNWNPKMKPYIFGIYNNIHIINLDKTIELFKIALIELKKIHDKKGKILFVGTKKIFNESIEDIACKCKQYFINNRWLGGTLTNWKTIKKSIKKLKLLEDKYEDKNIVKKFTKKELSIYYKNINKLKKNLLGIKNMNSLPDVLFIIDTINEKIAIEEANKLKIPVFAIADTNSNPDKIDFIIPGNDDSKKSANFYLNNIYNYLNN